ncbi:MAG TPA: hypothetical protein VLC06_10035 [Polyangia bacterium]|nr:hypothetical protein [Polyangia bacterium]
MTDIRKLAFVGLMSLGLATVGSAGCSSSSSTTGTGGSTGTGGVGTGTTGGSTGTGGAGTGTGGAAGATVGCATSDVPASPEIASFATPDGGISAMSGTFRYGDTPLPTFTLGTGMVNVSDTVQIDSKNHYQGFGLYMNGNAGGTDCVNGSSYTGIQFDLSGSLTGTGCAMVFSINDSEHADSTSGNPPDPKAGGPAGSYAPQFAITASQITSTAMPIKVPFTAPAFAGGAASPATAVDPTKLTGVQWQLAVPIATDGGATECVWNINLSNVMFY